MQWNDPVSQAQNRAGWERIQADAAADGEITVGPWLTRDYGAGECVAAVAATDPDLIVLEGEVPAQRMVSGVPIENPQAPSWEAIGAALEPYDISKAVATSFGPFQSYKLENGEYVLRPDPGRAAPLIERGWYCLPYVYPAEHLGATVAGQLAYANHYGPEWSHGECALGCYSGPHGTFTIDSPAFAGYDKQPGASVWDAGSVI